MNVKHFILLFIVILSASTLSSQETYGGLPYTFIINTTNPQLENYKELAQDIGTTYLSPYENDKLENLAEADALAEGSNRKYYGKIIDQDLNLTDVATYQLIDGIKVYRYKISSSTANALQFYFSVFQLPPGGELYIYNADKTRLFGSLTAESNPAENDGAAIVVATIPLEGGEWILEYNEPAVADFSAKIVLKQVIHVFSKLAAETSNDPKCQVDAICSEADGFFSEMKSTVRITYSVPNLGWVGKATGNLINTTADSEGLYVLTAGHVLHNNLNIQVIDPATMMFWYRNEKDGCYNDGTQNNHLIPLSGKVTMGAISRSAKYIPDSYDYALLELQNVSKETLRPYGICYAGWDRSSTLAFASYPYTMFHHPDGMDKKVAITQNNDLESIVTVGGGIAPLGRYYRSMWNNGAPAPGSEGAGLFNNNKKIVGILSNGAIAACNADGNGYSYNNEPSRFSKFSAAYTDGNFGLYLDPSNSNNMTCNTFCPQVEAQPPVSGTKDFSVLFNINGNATFNHVSQVCANNVVLNSPTHWLLAQSSQHKLCQNITNMSSAARNDQNCYLGVCWCKAEFRKIFVSIQEFDNNFWTPLAPEFAEWLFVFDSDISTVLEDALSSSPMPLNIATFAPQGFQLQDGKNYRIKLGGFKPDVSPPQWVEYTASVKTLPQDVYFQSEYIATSQLAANNINISGSSHVPLTTPPINIIAGNQIAITGDIQMLSGRYYVTGLNCSNVSSYRQMLPDSLIKPETAIGSVQSNQTNVTGNSSITKNIKTSDLKEGTINIFPNPSSGDFNIAIELGDNKASVSAKLIGIDGKDVADCFDYKNQKGNFAYKVSTDNLQEGIYILKLTVNGKATNYKIVKTSDK